MAQKIQVRRDTVEAWADENPILALGEWGVSYTEDSIVAIKIGNGNDDWGSLDTVYPQNSANSTSARYIEPWIGFDEAELVNELWAMAPPNTLIWTPRYFGTSEDEALAPRGFYRTDGTNTLVRATEYDETVPFTVVRLDSALHATPALMADPAGLLLANVQWLLPDWNATMVLDKDPVGASDHDVFMSRRDPLPENFYIHEDDFTLRDWINRIDEALGTLGASTTTVVGYIAEDRLNDETGFNAYDGAGALSIVLWADLESGVTVFVRDSGRVCTADGEGAYTTVTASQGQYHTEDGVVAYMPEVGFPSILSPTSSGGAGGGGGARYIEPFMAFEFGPITDAIWEMAPPGVLFWCQAGGGGEGRMTRGFYRTDGTSTVVRDESYDVDAPFTVIHVLQGLYEDVSDFVDRQPYRGTSLLWVFSDWNATKEMPANHVGTTADLVSVDYEPENYTPSAGDDGGNTVGDHLAGIDNAIGEPFLDSVYVPTSGPLVDLATGMELEVETPEVLTLTGNTVHVRSVDQDHTGKTILVECTLVDQHDRSGRRLKGFEMVGTTSDAYSFALTLNGSLTPVGGSAWGDGRCVDTGIYLGLSGKAVAELNDSDGYPFSRSAQFTSPIPSNDLDDHRISIIVSTGPNPTFNGVIETEFEIVPVWEDANESYSPGQPSTWEDLTGDAPDSKTEALDMLVGEIGPIKHDIEDLIGAPERVDVTESIVGRTTKKVFIDASASNPDPFIVYLPKLEDVTDGHEIEFFRVDDTANVLQITPDGTTDDRFSLNDIATIPFVQVAPMVGRVRLVADTINGWWWPEASFDPTD